MHTYEYKCSKCKKVFEVFQKMSDKPLKVCIDKNCKGKVKRLIGTGAGFIFKGAGFYATDYRSPSYKKREKEDSSKRDLGSCKNCKNKGCEIDK